MPVTYFFTRLKTEEGKSVTLKPPCQTSGVKKNLQLQFLWDK